MGLTTKGAVTPVKNQEWYDSRWVSSIMSLDNYDHPVEGSCNFDVPHTGDEIWATDFDRRFSDRFLHVTHHQQVATSEVTAIREL